MKAVIVKNSEFQTIGFEVSSNGRTLYQWGISPYLKSNWQKEVNAEEWMTQIVDLIRLKGVQEERSQFMSNFFEVVMSPENNLVKEGQGVKMSEMKKRNEDLEKRIENIIKNIN